MSMICVSSKRPRGAPSFTTNLLIQGEKVACAGHESDDVARTCSFGGYTWLAPLTLVVATAHARRARSLLKRGPLQHDGVRMVEPQSAATGDVYMLSTDTLFSGEGDVEEDPDDIDCLLSNLDDDDEEAFGSDDEDG